MIPSPNGNPRRTPTVAIIGAGMSGLCMGAKLRRAGIETFTIYEKASQLGGTWRDNTYPGLTCDVPSRFYQFTFAPNPDWSHTFSPGGEIWRYFDGVADRLGLRSHIELDTRIAGARYEGGRWRFRTDAGAEREADFLISACGVLHHPRFPEIAGLDSFGGAAFHSARWDHDVPLEGRRVGVVGTGSTGVQIVCALAGVAKPLTLFQRTPQWVLRLSNPPFSPRVRAAHRRYPWLDRWDYWRTKVFADFMVRALTKPGIRRRLVGALCRRNLGKVEDLELRRKLTPGYQPMCKRLVVSEGFYDAMQRDDVELVTEAIDHVEEAGIVTADGVLHELDVIALATGFDAHAYMRPLDLVGRDGITLDQAWEEGPRAYRTVALPGFPNFFMLMGPHSPVGNYPLTAIAETQAGYIMEWIRLWRERRIEAVEPTPAATAAFNAQMRAAMPNTVWATGCDSWYLGKDGLPELWPWTPDKHREMLSSVALDDFAIQL